MSRRFFWTALALLVVLTGLLAMPLFPGRPGQAWAATALFFCVAIGSQWAYRSGRGEGRAGFRALAWAGAVGVGLWATFILLSLPVDLGELAALALGPGARARLPPPHAQAVALFLAACALALIGLGQALAGPAVREVAIPAGPRAGALRGLRIALLSDLHVGPTIRAGYVEAVVRRIEELAPDLIAVTGDLVDGTVEQLSEQVAPLSRLRAPLGVYFATGNHEYYWDAPSWLAKIRELGFRPLVDESVVLEARGERLQVAGAADAAAAHFAPAGAARPRPLEPARPDCAFRLLLAHRPEVSEQAEKAGFDLQLSGHTHGGQFFPFSLLVGLAHKHLRGLHRRGRLWLYVSPGTGYWGPPHRFGVPSEITLLRLV